ncbi:MAG: DNA helicase II [Candidatus Muproteobacteria bacterium RIFCSPHIGHO2_12_FULL_60_33]|uniref:DNA 3'-5' helicase n=1 Tax=Candidatus Muproteobacteria bacterium RIFCSPLOWO2_01_FULL_60_18 TaxID=1817768 RepID=A0A1F6U662_9PROT|nr:MAG: DNA helicase II [Candidatus Muproteobacteria bacterium RIFCSPHIGHO2_01_60_12]OGI52885.1 MAG: DNA helicase II [Candidatus Muproteobacteria bacterium RIFCSPLOWO2_01_FULL_60_18]OGI54304.1 MAG: DNA helicase II [Candidatus Muproteobacteria bacterium RIFCSPHIGHO2_12_FULL_60_33]OGI59308.1 MAG: DNA helicase II [Candidatus Muproteobacteria bacterium RIFCSPHIGHO2_01_FULL_61_200]
MDVSHLMDDLNDVQREAVAAPAGPLLVLAGAGSGKTRVLTHRVAWLVGVEGVSPHAILAVTFTNKAAHEMRGRIESMLQAPVGGMWIGTFHGLSHRLLRSHWREANLAQTFAILDSEDQLRVIKRLMKSMNLDEAYWPPKQAMWFINGHKEEGRRPKDIGEANDPTQRELRRVYVAYEETCQRSGLVDFAELLLRAYELLRDNPTMRAHYQARFRHVLVDEFQDTNRIQYAWLRQFVGPERNLFVVGDDDQSIYGWRGAKVENILKFENDFPGTRTIRLEQNYRSTGTILKAANAVIGHNTGRLGKNLWTTGEEGEPLQLYTGYTDFDEARFVVDRIQDWVARGHARAECAVLYRSNAQSRLFEERLINEGIPYRVYGGLRFFERAEIKDALAYLRLMASRHDDASFERVVNLPTRGIGAKTVDTVRERARGEKISLWDAALKMLAATELPARAREALNVFLQLIERLAGETAGLALGETVEHMLAGSGLIEHYKKEKGEKAESRVENLEELINAARGYEHDEAEGLDPLSSFLAHAALEAGEGQAEAWEDCVQLMSLHSAKGLEFPLVFLTGLEEGLFPHQHSLQDPTRLEEERRLCYVGMTRARQQLVLTQAELRRLHGNEHYTSPSRFLGEIPEELIQEIRAKPAVTASPSAKLATGLPAQEPPAGGMRLGSRVRHGTFGDGVVLRYEGQGSHARVQVNFEAAGTKWLVIGYANLQSL